MTLPEIHIFVGAGGVGKTTVSAAYAIALASSGKRVALLSIDPAKRLQSALGQEELLEMGTRIPVGQNGGELVAALLHPHQTIRRWARETTKGVEAQKRLESNPFFTMLCDKVATATDAIAAMRIAEWSAQKEGQPFDIMVIDTAPGIHAIDFLTKPDKLLAFFDSKLIDWLKWFLTDANSKVGLLQKMVMSGARKILDGLALIGGQNMLLSFAEFIVAMEGMIKIMMERLQVARTWLRSPEAHYFVVAAVRPDASATAQELARALVSLGVKPTAAVINRAQDTRVLENLKIRVQSEKSASQLKIFLTYGMHFLEMQEKLKKDFQAVSQKICELPNMLQLDANGEQVRLADLKNLGQNLVNQLWRR